MASAGGNDCRDGERIITSMAPEMKTESLINHSIFTCRWLMTLPFGWLRKIVKSTRSVDKESTDMFILSVDNPRRCLESTGLDYSELKSLPTPPKEIQTP